MIPLFKEGYDIVSHRAIPKMLPEHNKLFRKRDTNGSSDNSAI